MTATLLESPLSLFAEHRRIGSAGGHRATLEERLDATWRAVLTGGEAECPVCHGTMRRENGAGRCTGCGSMLT
jgi:hypothetical protein